MHKNTLEFLNILITIILFSLIGFSIALSAISIQNDLYFGGSYGIIDVRDISLTPTSTVPASVPGKIYYNSSDQKPYIFDGSNWTELGGGGTATGDFVSKTGDTMTGKLTISINGDDMITFVHSGVTEQYTLALGNDGTLALKNEAGTVRLKIDSLGNVGIGTITPTQKLQVEGNIKLGGTEGDIYGLNWIVGNNDLFLKSNSSEDSSLHLAGSELIFWSGSQEQWKVNSTGTLLKGAVPLERLINLPTDCPENQYLIGINPDGTFKCGFIDYCSITYKCAESDGLGGCIAKPAGEYNLPACQYCDGISLDPAYYGIDEQDTTGPNVCDNTLGTCYGCNGSGNCSFQTSASDTGNQCGTSGCSTGYCSGTGYSCGVYSSGQGGCGLCMKCDPAGSGSCIPQASNEDLGDECETIGACDTGFCSGIDGSCGTYICPTICQKCLGDGSSCGICTDYEECTNCTQVCKGCVNGVCTNIPVNQADIYGDNLCSGHSRCDGSGNCVTPKDYRCVYCSTPKTCTKCCSDAGYYCQHGFDDSFCQAPPPYHHCDSSSHSCWCWRYVY